MNTKIIIIIALSILLALGAFLYLNKNNELTEAMQKNTELKNAIGEKENDIIELKGELDKANSDLSQSQNENSELQKKVDQSNEEINSLKSSNSKLRSNLAYYSSQLKKEKNKLKAEKNKKDEVSVDLLAKINDKLSKLAGHQISKISIFNDDSSYANLSGRRNFLSLDGKGNLKMERVEKFTSTGQYLQAIYQDKDNGNNRLITTVIDVPMNKLRIADAKVIAHDKTENNPANSIYRKENYYRISIPLRDTKSLKANQNIEFKGETFDKKIKTNSLEIYTTTNEDAVEVLSYLNLISILS